MKIAKSHKNLGIGIHFTLVKGSPVLPASEIKSLVNSSGNFHDDFSVFVKRYLTGKIDFNEVKAKLSAQVRKIKNSGIKISHVDSHQHLHVLPKVFAIISDLAMKLNVNAMRTPKAGGNMSISKLALNFLTLTARRKAEKLDFKIPDEFFGIVAGGSVNEKYLCSVIDKIHGTAEIMTHIGKDNEILQKFLNWDHDFEMELNAVKSEIVKEKLKNSGVEIINFYDI